jgi:hypothetical protein
MGNIMNKQEGLIDAAFEGRIDDVRKYLKDETVNVNWTDDGGITALFKACWNGHRDVAELLLDNGADIDARTYYDNLTPLMQACIYGHTSTTKLLLDRGCAVNAVDDNNWTALHIACWRGSTECIIELLTYGADTSSNQNGNTPFDLAKQRGYQAIIDILMEHKTRSEQNLKDSNEGENTSTLSDVSTLKTEVEECVASTLDEQLSSKVESIVSHRCKELHDMIASKEEEMNQTVQKLTIDFESKIEALRSEISAASQLTISSVSNLSTIVENLSLKVSSSQGHHDSNEETAAIEEHQHVGEDDFEMIS